MTIRAALLHWRLCSVMDQWRLAGHHGADRLLDVDGNRDEERNSAGRLHEPITCARDIALRGGAQGGAEADASGADDCGFDDLRHAAPRVGHGGWVRMARTDGDRRDRGSGDLDAADPRGRARRLYLAR
jgi:hypothetical protein